MRKRVLLLLLVMLGLALSTVSSPKAHAALPPPLLTAPANGETLSNLSVALSWSLPIGSLQEQLQVIPANGDGPGINLIRNASGQFSVPPPPTWYVLLPGMSYTWRVRVIDKPTFAPEDDPTWGPWSEPWVFHTPLPSSAGLSPVMPPNGVTLSTLGPTTLQWAHPDPTLFYWEVQVSGDRLFDTNPATATSFVWWNLVHGGVTNPINSWRTPTLGLIR